MSFDRSTLSPAVSINRVKKRFDDFEAVRGLDLQVHPGELFGFLGPNGAGKTTTLLMLTGLLRPTEGDIQIYGHDVVTQAMAAKQLCAFIPDRPYVHEKLTGYEFIECVDEIYHGNRDTRHERSQELLATFELSNFADELIEGYSHGMRQRLLFATSLIHNPQLLVVDEPMVGLDPKGARLIKKLLRQRTQQGATVIMSTHTLNIAQELCDRIAIMHHGRCIALGTYAELKSQFDSPTSSLEELFLNITAGN